MSNISDHFKTAAKHHEALSEAHKSAAEAHETIRSFHEGQGSTAAGLSLAESHGHRAEQSHHLHMTAHHEKLSKMHSAHAAHLKQMASAQTDSVLSRAATFGKSLLFGGGQERADDDFMAGLNMRKDAPYFDQAAMNDTGL
jgi:hypothetical protein